MEKRKTTMPKNGKQFLRISDFVDDGKMVRRQGPGKRAHPE